MTWIFLGITAGSIGYLMMVIFGFVEQHREVRGRIEQTEIDLRRIKKQYSESEKSRYEAENRRAKLEAEALQLEHEVSDIRQKINSAMPTEERAPKRP